MVAKLEEFFLPFLFENNWYTSTIEEFKYVSQIYTTDKQCIILVPTYISVCVEDSLRDLNAHLQNKVEKDERPQLEVAGEDDQG